MTAPREELHHLVDELSDEEIPTALALLRARAGHPAGSRPPRWFGAGQAREPDISECVDEILRGRLVQREVLVSPTATHLTYTLHP